MVSFSPALLREAENFTLFIKNSISFPRFQVNRCVGERAAAGRGLREAASAGLGRLAPLPLPLPLRAPGWKGPFRGPRGIRGASGSGGHLPAGTVPLPTPSAS